MMHKYRTWCVVDAGGAEWLAEQLSTRTFTTCTGFRLGAYLFLNDSTGPDGIQEFAIVKGDRQIESATVSWMTPGKLLAFVRDVVAGRHDASPWAESGQAAVSYRVETPSEHGRCPACA